MFYEGLGSAGGESTEKRGVGIVPLKNTDYKSLLFAIIFHNGGKHMKFTEARMN